MNLTHEAPINISVVIPVYKAADIIDELISRLENVLGPIFTSYEIILIDDRSPDNSWDKIISNSKNNPMKIKGLRLSRNFGQHYAITAGIDFAKGDWIVVMDCDLQDRPEEIPKLYDTALQGYEIVLALRTHRKDNILKKAFSKLFYSILSYLTGTYQDPSIANFGIYSRKVIDSVVSLRENIRYFPTMIRWVGYKRKSVPVEHSERAKGKTTYTFRKLLNLSLNIMLAYSDKPIRISVVMGFMLSFISFIFALFVFYLYITNKVIVSGYASLIISISFFSGLIIFILGIIGLYVGKTFESTKNRPLYFVDDKTF
jgi:glycosyltransferase involved in cell wall biosynthesis